MLLLFLMIHLRFLLDLRLNYPKPFENNKSSIKKLTVVLLFLLLLLRVMIMLMVTDL